MHYVTYLRVSTDRQGKSGLGLDAQRKAVADHVAGKGEIAAEYVEIESGKKNDRPQLARALAEAKRIGAHSVAFPAISAGVYGWPMDDAARIAVETVRETADEVGDVVTRVVFVPFGEQAERAFRAQLDSPTTV